MLFLTVTQTITEKSPITIFAEFGVNVVALSSAETTAKESAKVKTPKTENRSNKIINDLPNFMSIPPFDFFLPMFLILLIDNQFKTLLV
ncbi:MAG: hypothetical protein LUQ24_04515 [Methanobacterium sp.]|nr:hypothetical protein [Methanobacterium sp.]